MAKRKFELTPEELADLTGVLMDAGTDPAYDRLRAVLDYHNGEKWAELTSRYHCSRSTLLSWCRNYRRLGSEALINPRPAGTVRRLSGTQVNDLMQRLSTATPAGVFTGDETTDRKLWTAKDLFRAIRIWYGVVYNSPTTYYTLLARFQAQADPPEHEE